ncbi:MAG: LytTR family DNA-binding domain-containing protein, partial [Coriobacteriia bacterium]|nr:LytTR family DNA-binding domain-containing protein [Coriobacteriia bacterium]
GVKVVGEAGNVVEATRLIKTVPCDVIFLDIHMPGFSGVQLAEALLAHARPPAIVFVTAHSEHAVKAFEVRATDYLVKPVELDRLKQAVSRLVPVAEQGSAKAERISVEKAGKKLLINAEDIFYIMSKDDYSYLLTRFGRYLSTMSLASLEAKLEASGFFRTHRRYLVNLTCVKEVETVHGGTLFLTLMDEDATQVPVSRRRVSSLKKALGF